MFEHGCISHYESIINALSAKKNSKWWRQVNVVCDPNLILYMYIMEFEKFVISGGRVRRRWLISYGNGSKIYRHLCMLKEISTHVILNTIIYNLNVSYILRKIWIYATANTKSIPYWQMQIPNNIETKYKCDIT